MYTKINILNSLEQAAAKFVMDNDRSLYTTFFETAERFCIQNSVLIGGRVGIDLIVGNKLAKDSFTWDLYCDDTFNTAKRLVIELSNTKSPHIPANTASLQTNIRYKEFTIYVNARILFRIYVMDKYKGIKLIDMMGPAVRTSYLTKALIKCIPEEMQLISIYRTLYSPAKLSLWPTELENEKTIYSMIKDSLQSKTLGQTVTGAGQSAQMKRIHDCLIHKLVKSNNYVLIGDYAISLMGMSISPVRVQFISSDDIDNIRKRCERCISEKDNRIKVTYMKYPLNLPNDFQVLKYTLYITTDKRQTAIADIFNSSAFEMIPFVPINGIRIGNPWVLLRFLFIDIWILKLILNIGGESSPSFITDKIVANIRSADAIHSKIAKDGPEAVFQLTNYAGKYVDEFVAKKKLIKESGERFPIFYPAKPTTYPMGGADNAQIKTTAGATSEGKSHAGAGHARPRIYRSGSIDLSIDIDTKKKILMKIVGRVIDNDILKTLQYHESNEREYSRWGTGKSVDAFYHKNAKFIKHIPQEVDVYVDIGCGDGLDITAIRQKYKVNTAICIDIEDFRDEKHKQASTFLKVTLGAPLDLPDNYADLIVVFHSLHHMQDDALARLVDIVRITQVGGLIFIKDHDVQTALQASNVDFEHLVYEVGKARDATSGELMSLEKLLVSFGEVEPMTYYSRTQIHNTMKDAGCKLIWTGMISHRTYIYGSVFKKTNEL